MILETAVECARVCRARGVRQGATTQWADAHKAEQRRMAPRAWRNRAYSAVTQKINLIEEEVVNVRAAVLGLQAVNCCF
jgi:hypothetical protein